MACGGPHGFRAVNVIVTKGTGCRIEQAKDACLACVPGCVVIGEVHELVDEVRLVEI